MCSFGGDLSGSWCIKGTSECIAFLVERGDAQKLMVILGTKNVIWVPDYQKIVMYRGRRMVGYIVYIYKYFLISVFY